MASIHVCSYKCEVRNYRAGVSLVGELTGEKAKWYCGRGYSGVLHRVASFLSIRPPMKI